MLSESAEATDPLWRDAVLADDVQPHGSRRRAARSRVALLTGATGFVGAHVLASLLDRGQEQVVCLVRAPSREEARSRIRSTLERFRLDRPDLHDRIQVQLGQLDAPRLGFSEDTYAELAERVDAICHCAAWVHATHPYETLRAVNVGGTASLLRFATTGRQKRFCHASGLSVFLGCTAAPETSAPDLGAGSREGYYATKWVSERLVWQAIERGVDAHITRLGWISGSARTGLIGRTDGMYMLIRACLRLGHAPQLSGGALNLTPVDIAADAMAHATVEGASGSDACNLYATHRIPERELWNGLRPDKRIASVPVDQWRQSAAARFPLMAKLMVGHAFIQEETPSEALTMPVVDDARARELVSKVRPCLPTNEELLRVYAQAWS